MKLKSIQTTPKSAEAVDAIDVLLGDLIDYAGLFPPASLDMPATVANFDAYSRSEFNWILGRFILPAARLGEFEQAFAGLTPATPGPNFANWRLSVLLGPDVTADVARIHKFNDRIANSGPGRRAVIDSVETKAASAEEVRRLSGIIPPELTTYFEVPTSGCDECIAAMASCGRRAKIRTGGETADKFPAPESVIEFVRRCAAANVAFKATAGLHHPMRSVRRFSYQPESASGIMHGFLNVFLAAAFLRAGMKTELAVKLLEEQSPQAFHFDLDGVGWRERRLGRDEIAATRKGFAVSFGSCSFTEPIDDLKSLHLL